MALKVFSCLAQLQPGWNSATRRGTFRDSNKQLCKVSLVLYELFSSDGNDDEKGSLAIL